MCHIHRVCPKSSCFVQHLCRGGATYLSMSTYETREQVRRRSGRMTRRSLCSTRRGTARRIALRPAGATRPSSHGLISSHRLDLRPSIRFASICRRPCQGFPVQILVLWPSIRTVPLPTGAIISSLHGTVAPFCAKVDRFVPRT